MAFASFSTIRWPNSDEERDLEKKATGRPHCKSVPAIALSETSVSTTNGNSGSTTLIINREIPSFMVPKPSKALEEKKRLVHSMTGRIFLD